jgi:hypothetical protein
MALQQEVGVLLAAVLVHAAAGVARGLVALVEGVVLLAKGQRQLARDQVVVALGGAALGAVRPVAVDRDAHRHAGPAGVAVGAVGEDAAAAEAGAHQLAVDARVDQVAGGGDLRAGDAAGKV